MALFLMTAAAWSVVAARDHSDATLLVLAGAALLALANATKYATLLFDPVIIALAVLSVAAKHGMKPGMARGGYLAVASFGLLGALLALGGPLYITGVLSTTVARATGGDSPLRVLMDSAEWIGWLCLIAVLAIAVALFSREHRFQVAIFTLLAGAAFLVPLNQARIQTTTSLSKHVDFGAWFAAVAAGYAIARLSRIGPWRQGPVVAAVLALGIIVLPIGILGRAQAWDFFQVWPNSSKVTEILRSLTKANSGNYLAEDYDVEAYYLENSIRWQRWSNTWYFSYARPGATRPIAGPAAYQAAVRDHYFSLIILDFGDTANVDRSITGDIRKAGDYHVIAEAPYWDKFGTGQFTIWAYQPSHPNNGPSHMKLSSHGDG
jgi:hypothetical protein